MGDVMTVNAPSTEAAGGHTSARVTVVYASMSGNTRDCAEDALKALAARGIDSTAIPIEKYDPARLAGETGPLLILTSTFGNGEPPYCANHFWEVLLREDFPALPDLRYAVAALGDSAYPRFCQFGRDVDERLEALGAARIVPRVDCDVDYEAPFAAWLAECLDALGRGR